VSTRFGGRKVGLARGATRIMGGMVSKAGWHMHPCNCACVCMALGRSHKPCWRDGYVKCSGTGHSWPQALLARPVRTPREPVHQSQSTSRLAHWTHPPILYPYHTPTKPNTKPSQPHLFDPTKSSPSLLAHRWTHLPSEDEIFFTR
jgi:hypothetical protein